MKPKISGELYILLEVFLWSLVPIISIITFATIPPLFTAAISIFCAAIFFATNLTINKEWKTTTSSETWKNILGATIILGILFYTFLFIGMKHTTASNTSLILNMEVFFAMIILGPLVKQEKINNLQILGAILMVVGSSFIIFPGTFHPNKGDILILLITPILPIGNLFAKKALKDVGPSYLMFFRSLISGAFILSLALLTEPIPSLSLLQESWIFLAINGFILSGFRTLLWLRGIKLINISTANTIATISPAFTLILAYFILHEVPTPWQIAGFTPIVLGVWLLVRNKQKPKDQ